MKKMFRKMTLLGLVCWMAISGSSTACTSFLVTKGASTDGSTMITYAADAHVLYGELYYRRAAAYPAGTLFQVIDWDSGKSLVKIPQIAQTYSTVGNMNEWGLAISETTYGGREELVDKTGGIDYGSLIYITLQRAKTAREAIQTMAELVENHGYYSGGESFSIADGNEVWVMELIGKGDPVLDKKGKVDKRWSKGAVWVAMRVPDGYICGHANQARITTFEQEKKGSFKSISSKNLKEIFRPEVEIVYAADVISFARLKNYFDGADADFSFSDTYAPLTFSGARACEARVYAGFNRVNKNMKQYESYAMGHNLSNRMPLWIKPDNKLSVQDVMGLMRDHYEGTPMDMTKDIGAGPFACPYRWRPMGFTHNGEEYIHERATSTQQTGFSFVAQTRSGVPAPLNGILWFGVDDTYSSVYVPIYCGVLSAPACFEEGNGNMVTYSETSAFWLFNQVSNFVYSRYANMIKHVVEKQQELENSFVAAVAAKDKELLALYNAGKTDQVRQEMTAFSNLQSEVTFQAWTNLYRYLLVKYIDGNIKVEENGKFKTNPYNTGSSVSPEQPLYPEKWYDIIVKDHGDVIRVPKK